MRQRAGADSHSISGSAGPRKASKTKSQDEEAIAMRSLMVRKLVFDRFFGLLSGTSR